MPDADVFSLERWDYIAFAAYFVVLCFIGLWVGRKEKTKSDDYFLAGRSLPWYVVGSSFVASNISTEHFIGMIGAAFVYGICVAMWEWGNVLTFTLLIWFFIPFLLASRVFTTPEFMERRFHPFLRQSFAVVTIITNVVAFLAAVLYGGGLALQNLFGWDLWFAIIALGVVAGSWAIYGGLKSVAWTDFFTVIIMIVGGIMVTLFGLDMLSGEEHSIVAGWKVMVDRNQAHSGVWRQAVETHLDHLAPGSEAYSRLSVIQSSKHPLLPWPSLFLMVFTISIWYNVINQFMIQRVLGAKNMYHARMGIVLAGYMKVLMPAIVVIPGLILFAVYPEVMLEPWADIKPKADQGYVHMLQMLIPVGLRGLFLAALFGAIQSTVNSVLNSTATIFTLDIYKRALRPQSSERHLVRVGMVSSVLILLVSIVLAGYIQRFESSLFVYIQTLYAFFAPPFAAVFLLGILWRRINGTGAIVAVVLGFIVGIVMKLYIQFVPQIMWLFDPSGLLAYHDLRYVPPHVATIEPFLIQAIINWAFCIALCVVVSLLTERPRPEQVTEELTFHWSRLNIFEGLGTRWYNHVVLWWGLFVLLILGLVLLFSGLWL